MWGGGGEGGGASLIDVEGVTGNQQMVRHRPSLIRVLNPMGLAST